MSERGLKYKDVKSCFVGIEALGVVDTLYEIKRKFATASNLIEALVGVDELPINIDMWPRLKDVGNLNYDMLFEIVSFLNLTPSLYSSRKLFIDETLIGTRNKIAHGERLIVDRAAIESTFDETLALMVTFKTDVEDAVTASSFLRAAMPA